MDGFIEVGSSQGSLYSCYFRQTTETRACLTGDVVVPPGSSSPPEMVQRSLMIQVVRAEVGALTVEVDGMATDVGPGSVICVAEQQKYIIRNTSDATSARLKATMLKV